MACNTSGQACGFSRPSLGSEYLDASLSTDLFLGYDSSLPGNLLEVKDSAASNESSNLEHSNERSL